MKTRFPDFDNCLVNLANSVLKYYTGKTFHDSLPYLDKVLAEREYKNIVVILIDGMGSNIMKRNLPKNSFLRRHQVGTIDSVFPATTASATTSILTGKYPIETGWLGWEMYFPEVDEVVEQYRNRIKRTQEILPYPPIWKKYIPFKSLPDIIDESGVARGVGVSPCDLGTNKLINFKEKSLRQMCKAVRKECANSERSYVCAYFDLFDTVAHDHGSDSWQAKQVLKKVNRRLEKLMSKLNDTLVVITADHGHLKANYHLVSDYPKLYSMLARTTSIDSRATGFFVKPRYRKEFAKEFWKVFNKKDFELLTRQEVLARKVFGYGKMHPFAKTAIGDYLAISKGEGCIANDDYKHQAVSTHAGISEDEVVVPLIVVKT